MLMKSAYQTKDGLTARRDGSHWSENGPMMLPREKQRQWTCREQPNLYISPLINFGEKFNYVISGSESFQNLPNDSW
jgi:hypothetical protein